MRTYDLELEPTSDQCIWAYRRTARTVDRLQENIADLSRGNSEIGTQTLSGIGIQFTGLIARWLDEDAIIKANETSSL